jgi:negative regulator of sigma E activity
MNDPRSLFRRTKNKDQNWQKWAVMTAIVAVVLAVPAAVFTGIQIVQLQEQSEKATRELTTAVDLLNQARRQADELANQNQIDP